MDWLRPKGSVEIALSYSPVCMTPCHLWQVITFSTRIEMLLSPADSAAVEMLFWYQQKKLVRLLAVLVSLAEAFTVIGLVSIHDVCHTNDHHAVVRIILAVLPSIITSITF